MIDQQDALQTIQGTAGFLVIETLAKKKLEDLQDIENIDEHLAIPVEVQALGRKYAKQLITEFLIDINVLQKPIKESTNTYE